MKKLLSSLCFIALCFQLNAQDFKPYQKGEIALGISSPRFLPLRSYGLIPPSESSNKWGADFDLSTCFVNRWAIGLGGTFSYTEFNQNELLYTARGLGFHAFTRYYSPAIKLGTTHLNLFGELRLSTNYSSASHTFNRLSYRLNSLYGGFGFTYRPIKFLSLDFLMQRSWYRLKEQPFHLRTQPGKMWLSTIGINYHFIPKGR